MAVVASLLPQKPKPTVAEPGRSLSVIGKLEATVEVSLTHADRLRQSILAPDAFWWGQLEKGDKQTPLIERQRLDVYLLSHLIDPTIFRNDDFAAFMKDQQKRLLGLIEQATGKAAYTGEVPEEGMDVRGGEDALEAEMIIRCL